MLASAPLPTTTFQVQILSTENGSCAVEASQGGWIFSITFLHHCGVGGTIKAKFEIELASGSFPASPTPGATSTASGGDRRRRRHRVPAALAKSKARVVAHQASLAMPPPPPPPPPPPASTKRLIKVVPRRSGFRPSLCQLDGEGGGEDSEEEGDPPPPTPFSCASICRTADQHCWNC